MPLTFTFRYVKRKEKKKKEGEKERMNHATHDHVTVRFLYQDRLEKISTVKLLLTGLRKYTRAYTVEELENQRVYVTKVSESFGHRIRFSMKSWFLAESDYVAKRLKQRKT